MDRRFKLSLLGAVVFAAANSHTIVAQAADLLPPPAIVEAPEIVQKSNTGWYLRGDISYDFTKSDGDLHVPYVTTLRGGDFDDAFDVGVGIGYQVTNHFRVDLTADYVFGADYHARSAADVPCSPHPDGFTGSCASTEASSVDKLRVMANGYVDLGHFAGFTPYVGAGIGGVRVSYDDLHTTKNCTITGHPTYTEPTLFRPQEAVPTHCGYTPAYGTAAPATPYESGPIKENAYAGVDSWRFAYSLHAGASYALSHNAKLDFGYSYTKIEGGKAFEGNQANNVDLDIYDKGFDDHTVRVGLRYALH